LLPVSSTPGTWTSSPSLGSWVSPGTEAKLSRSAAEGVAHSLARHLNRALNQTVSDSHLSVSPIDGVIATGAGAAQAVRDVPLAIACPVHRASLPPRGAMPPAAFRR
jgi:hypothetical protein